MKHEDCFLLGYVVRPHGIRGDVSIFLDVDDPSDYNQLESVFIEMDKNLVPFFIEWIRIRGAKAQAHFANIDSTEAALEIQSCALYLPLDQLPTLKDDQFYYHDVIGYEVKDRKLGKLGKIETVYSRSGQDLLAMKYQGREILIPVDASIVGRADHQEKIVMVDLPDGLLELFLED